MKDEFDKVFLEMLKSELNDIDNTEVDGLDKAIKPQVEALNRQFKSYSYKPQELADYYIEMIRDRYTTRAYAKFRNI